VATARLRLDALLVARGLADDAHTATALVLAGGVVVDDHRADKPGLLVRADAAVRLKSAPGRFVSRGGDKLAGTLDALAIDVAGLRCVDVGASTGGFTDCLLQRGAAAVVAVDVGRGLLHERLRQDARVIVRDRTHARDLRPEHLPFAADLLVADLSFIGLRPLLPALLRAVRPGGALLLMVKPQFEADRGEVPPGGVITDPDLGAAVVARVAAAARGAGAAVLGSAPAGVAGPKGNREVFLWLRRTEEIAS